MGLLEGKVVIVTGAGQGIGRAYAQRAIAEGARVAVAEINAETGERAAAELGDDAMFTPVDVADEDSTTAMAASVIERFGAIDVLINNAAIYFDLDQGDTSVAYLKKVLEVNMLGPWLCARAVVPSMKERGSGVILNQSSGAAWLYAMTGYAMPKDSDVLPGFPYPLAKAGVNALTHYMAAALGKFGIRVNAIAPGVTMTAATEKHVPESMRGMLSMMAALGRTLEPDEIASVAVFLASDEARGITGQVIPVDAGVTMLG